MARRARSPRSVRRAPLAAAVVALALCSLGAPEPAAADQRPVSATCPVCATEVQGAIHDGQNAAGGRDSDFCTYTVERRREPDGAVAVVLGREDVLTCRACLFSALLPHFAIELTDDARRRIREALAGARPPAPEARNLIGAKQPLPPRVRFELAIQTYELLGNRRFGQTEAEHRLFLAHLWHRAAWCVRERAAAGEALPAAVYDPRTVGESLEQHQALERRLLELRDPARKDQDPLALALAEAAATRRALLEVARVGAPAERWIATMARDRIAEVAAHIRAAQAREGQRPVSPVSRPSPQAPKRERERQLVMAAARAAHRAGLTEQRDRWMREARVLAARPGDPDEKLAAEVDALAALVADEGRLLRFARDLFRQTLAEGLPEDPVLRRRYEFLAGDISRRLGERTTARGLLARVVEAGRDDLLDRSARRLLELLEEPR